MMLVQHCSGGHMLLVLMVGIVMVLPSVLHKSLMVFVCCCLLVMVVKSRMSWLVTVFHQ